MLSYIDVTELVRRADNLERLRAALDKIEHGIILMDRELNVEFMNAAVCRLWQLPDRQPDGKPAFSDLVGTARQSKCLGMSGEALEIYLEQRIARVRAGDPRPMDIRHQDGRIIRSQCSVLPNGGRMLSYVDVTDLIRRADDARRFGGGRDFNRPHLPAATATRSGASVSRAGIGCLARASISNSCENADRVRARGALF